VVPTYCDKNDGALIRGFFAFKRQHIAFTSNYIYYGYGWPQGDTCH
jgi:hypothetical protein